MGVGGFGFPLGAALGALAWVGVAPDGEPLGKCAGWLGSGAPGGAMVAPGFGFNNGLSLCSGLPVSG